jgi:hypothetical protein
MKNKILAIFGIGTYILSVLSSAINLEGTPVVPSSLIIISGIAIAVFVIMATIRLWKKAKKLSITFLSSAGILFLLTTIQEFTLPSYGSSIIILTNIAKVVYIGAFIFVTVRLFKTKEEIVSSGVG